MARKKRVLKMSFDPHTIEHLGIKMYSNLPTAIAELIANAYDADAEEVKIFLVDDEQSKEIIVEDDGIGMTFKEINDLFLRIGRNRRQEGYGESPDGRKTTGKKGLGKLAFFGIGDTIEISTIAKNSNKEILFTLDWNELIKTKKRDYQPKFRIRKSDGSKQGTKIKLTNLKRKSSFNKDELAVSISKLFNFMDTEFRILLYLNNDEPLNIDNKLKFSEIKAQFTWNFPQNNQFFDHEYEYSNNFKGKLITTKKPLKPGLRGITLYANGRLVNAPEFFGASESSHFFSYLTGWYDVDFVDDWDEDVITTNRQTLNWDLDKTIKLRITLRDSLMKIEKDWRLKRNEERIEEIKEKTKVDISSWYEALPPEVQKTIESVVNTIVDESELSDTSQSAVVSNIHSLVPEYPYYHWRHLHDEIKNASETDYKNADYYRAFLEAAKRYINGVRCKTGSTNSSDSSMMGEVFGRTGSLKVCQSYRKPNGTDFQTSTKENIEEGQKFISMGMVTGCRNPVSHEEVIDLRDSGLFSEKDCLDALSMLSHLFRRFGDS